MSEVIWKLEIDIVAPVLTQSSSYRRFGLDATMARTVSGDALIIPGTLVTGKLKHAWKELRGFRNDLFGLAPKSLGGPSVATADLGSTEQRASAASDADIETIARAPSSPSGRELSQHYAPDRKCLTFSDLRLEIEDLKVDRVMTRIQMDEERGSAAERMLRAIEQLDPSGKVRTFVGEVRYRGAERANGSRDEAGDIGLAIKLGLDWIAQLGSGRSVGYGRINGADGVRLTRDPPGRATRAPCEPEAGQTARAIAAPLAHGLYAWRIGLSLYFTEPFCFAETQPAGNLFVGGAAVPGAAIKGALAAAWKRLLGPEQNDDITAGFDERRPQLCRHFDALIFRFAFSSENGRRPVMPPLSLGQINTLVGGLLFDFALAKEPGLVCGQAPAFAPDWKDPGKVSAAFGHPRLHRELRVRTAIDPGSQAAAETQLFAYETVVPQPRLRWLGEIVIPASIAAPDARAVEEELHELIATLGGVLPWLGKTKAQARLVFHTPAPDAVNSNEPLRKRIAVVALQTAGLLVPPETFAAGQDRDALVSAFAAYWGAISEGTLTLLDARFFARHRLAGGRYLWSRFQGGKPYLPWVLTAPGSVFVLNAQAGLEEAAQGCLARWTAEGLPLPAWVATRYESTPGAGDGGQWHRNPFIPENGFGEVHVNLETHWDMLPRSEIEIIEEARHV